ncbi:unnamed protein product [Clavelina lepadiformis]|uniref:C2H2-type domain-containing protein n=1 Tax=Clavelina lepadiformis TaxID=159417 RepID=A0ABP0F9H8_CLALP
MECHPDNMHVDFLLKAISDMVLQELKSMREDMKIEFAKVQENMEDMVSKILVETKKAETINNAIPIKETSQTLDVESDIGICIKGVHSENATVLPLVEAIKEEPLLLQHWEVSETDQPSLSISNMFSLQSELGVNALVKTVEPQTCIVKDHSEKASFYPQFEVIEKEPLMLQKYAVSQTEIDHPTISMLNKLTYQSEIGVKATVKTIDTRNCIERSSDEERSNFVEMFFDNSATNDRNNACKVDAQLLVGNNKEKHFSCNFCDRSFKCKSNLKVHLRTHTDYAIICEDVLRNKQVEKDDNNKESSGDAIVVTTPKNKEVPHVLHTIRQRLQFEGADMATFVRLKTQMQESMISSFACLNE